MDILGEQKQITKQFPQPVDDMSASSSIQSVSGETVQLYYSNSGTRTSDAGQAAGTAVTGQLANKNILDAGGGYIATWKDTSLSFTCTALTTEVDFPSYVAEDRDNRKGTWATKLTAITAKMANGEYCVDYRSGTIYGVKTSTATSMTSTSYKVNQAQTGGSTTLPSAVNVNQWGSGAVTAYANPKAYGIDVAGADTYTTVVTNATTIKNHIYASVEGSYPAIISMDSGTTDHIYLPANTAVALDGVAITATATVQGKNGSAGNNYTNLTITIW